MSKTQNCIQRSKKVPKPFQKRVIRYINDPRKLYDGLLVVHGVGCGKTLEATIASQCYLDKYPDRKVVFVGPASLVNNFKNEVEYYGATNMNKYKFYSFSKFYALVKRGRRPPCKESLLIIDEAHNLRSLTSKKAKAIIRCAYTAHKKLLLTATPFINSPRDFINLINMVHGKEIADSDQFPLKATLKNSSDALSTLLKGRVDYIPSCRSSSDFPKVVEKLVSVPMSNSYMHAYENSIAGMLVGGITIPNPEKFLHGYRKAVNKAGVDAYYSEKLDVALSKIKTRQGKILKTVVFTNWLSYGVKAITKYLKLANIDFRVFKGGVSAKEKSKMVKDYNDNKYPVLVITKAGAEGLDLKETRNMIIMDPVWHDAGIQQIIGRAVRYRSHVNLPKKDRIVHVYKMMLTFPAGHPRRKTGDQMLYKIIERKNKLKVVVDQILERASTGSNQRPQRIAFSPTKKSSRRRRVSRKINKRDINKLTLQELKKLARQLKLNKKIMGVSVSSFRVSNRNVLENFIKNIL